MANQRVDVNVSVKATWVKPVVIFICRHIKKKWALRMLSNLTIAVVSVDGKPFVKVRLSDYITMI